MGWGLIKEGNHVVNMIGLMEFRASIRTKHVRKKSYISTNTTQLLCNKMHIPPQYSRQPFI